MADGRDAALVAAIRKGDVDRFGEVVARFERLVRGTVARGVVDPDGRDELVQQTFYLAFRRLGQLADPGRLQAWLLRIARNCVADYHRRRAREAAHRPPPRASAPSRAWIWEEVAALAPPFAEVLRLRYREGRSYAEIAQRLDVPPSTVRGRIYEARKALRRRLGEDRG